MGRASLMAAGRDMKNFFVGAMTVAGWLMGRSGTRQFDLMGSFTKNARLDMGDRGGAYDISLEAWHEPAPVYVTID